MASTIYQFWFKAMASRCEIRLSAPDGVEAARLAELAIAEVQRIEHKYSRYRPSSVVSRVNAQAGGDGVVGDDETNTLLDYAESLFVSSGGLFDITSGVLRKAWNFTVGRLPDPAHLALLCRLVDASRIERDGSCIRLPVAGMELDFGGFGKEYAADQAATQLMAQGVAHGYVNLAGDIRVMGPKLDGSPWMMGIQDPRQPESLVASIPMLGGALATSGDYERYMEIDGTRYCHILHPRTGWPVSQWRSISAVAPLTLTAGSLSTIAMLKEEGATAFLHDHRAVYLAVDSQGKFHRSM